MAVCTGITYNATDDRITIQFVSGDVKGNSFNDPYTLQDIYDTDQDNGWGVFQKYGNVYISDASLYIEGSDTYFGNTEKEVLIFQGSIDDYYTLTILTANIQLESFYMFMDPSVLYGGGRIVSNNISIKDGFFFFKKPVFLEGGSYENVKLRSNKYIGDDGANTFNHVITQATYGLYIRGDSSGSIYGNIKIINSNYGIRLDANYGLIDQIQMNNVNIVNSEKNDIWLRPKNSGNNVGFIDSNINIDSVLIIASYTGNFALNFKSTFKINIADGDGGTATLYDQFGSQVATQTLSGQWALADPVLYAKRYVETDGSSVVENTKTVYEPFKLVVKKDGYDTLEIPNITVTAGEETNVYGEMVRTEVQGENLTHELVEETIEHNITEDTLEHNISE
jgi:hypothetical protein